MRCIERVPFPLSLKISIQMRVFCEAEDICEYLNSYVIVIYISEDSELGFMGDEFIEIIAVIRCRRWGLELS